MVTSTLVVSVTAFAEAVTLVEKAGVDRAAVDREVAPGAHYFMGGLRIEPDASTSLPGVFAAGECSGGIHGANRLAGNALSENQVFGAIAGRSAARDGRRGRGHHPHRCAERQRDGPQ